MPAKRPALPGTLGAYAECGRQVFVVCNHCGRWARPQLQLIAQQAGWRTPTLEIGRRMRCSACRHRGVYFTTEPPHAGHSRRRE